MASPMLTVEGDNEEFVENEGSTLDLAYLDQDDETLRINLETYSIIGNSHNTARVLFVNHNRLHHFPSTVNSFLQLTTLDISSNSISVLPSSIVGLKHLHTLVAKHNLFSFEAAFPKNFNQLTELQHLNLAGNKFKNIPNQLFTVSKLKTLHLGSNELNHVSPSIIELNELECLYLGGNNLTNIPSEIGLLHHLEALYLSENKLECLPASIARLRRLKSLALHKNRLKTLPLEIVKLRCLTELSLRDNPLVVHFVRDMSYDPPSLLEIAARTVKIKHLLYNSEELPRSLIDYLNHAQRCVNPKCKGVYFDTRVENIKFVDFCGKYHLPLLQYLCSTKCDNEPAILKTSDSSESEEDEYVPSSRLRKVLLG